MRTTRRTIILLGCIGFVALYILQYRAALAVTPLILVVGALAGLAAAKWLPWAWYGRQFAAGARAGVVVCALSAAGVLLSLIGSGESSIALVAERSHLLGIDFSPFVLSIGALGWFTPYLLLTLFFTVSGVLLAGVVTQVFGWSKSVGTVRVIREAHNSASLLHRTQTWGPATNSAPPLAGYWQSVIPSADPVSLPGLLATGTMGTSGHSLANQKPLSAHTPSRAKGVEDLSFEQAHPYLAPLPSLDFEDAAPLDSLPAVPEPIPPRRSTSGVQPVQFALTDDLRNALEHWDMDSEPLTPAADENAAEFTEFTESTEPATPKKPNVSRAKTPSKRQPKASAYLNSAPPAAPRRGRKKQDTRDWLC